MIVSYDTIIVMDPYRPPYTITPGILNAAVQISEILGQLKSLRLIKPNPKLRKQNSIRTIQGSLAIEGNSFTLEQVSTVLEGKRVLGKPKEIQEVKNAIECYSMMRDYDPCSSKSLLKAHKVLMKGLIDKPGQFRSGAIGILKGSQVSHIAPKATNVPLLINQLLGYLKHSKELDLIKSCVFHYEFEFIHPFEDGNGRIGRLWQTLILSRYNPIFEFIPVESQIFANQREYYKTLEACDKKGESTAFIEWMLNIVLKSLREYSDHSLPSVENFESRIENARSEFGDRPFTRLDYMKFIKTVSAPTASRDLAAAVKKKILLKSGDKRTAKYWFVREPDLKKWRRERD